MPDLMISYSRKDTEFVKLLHQRLMEQGRDIWVDFDDIPKSAEWWKEIQEGIDKSNCFIFVISPDSVISEVCGWEVQHAVNSKKRVIPLLRREVTDAEHKKRIHPSISSHNWIFARETDDFEKFVQELSTAIDTDLGYVKAHTHLLVNAKEWDAANRDASLLMTGTDLKQAETLLTQSVGKVPEIAPLQEQFVKESRRVVRTRQMITSVVTVFVLIVVALTAFAAWQAIVAQEQRDIAQQNAATAVVAQGQAEVAREEAVRLSQASNALVALQNNNYDLALALALEANRDGSSPLTRRSLTEIAYHPGTRSIIDTRYHTGLAVTPDGTQVLGGGCADEECTIGFAALYDLTTGSIVREFDVTGMDNVYWLAPAITPDGNNVAISAGTEIRWFDLHTGELLRSFTSMTEWGFSSLAISADGTRLVAGDMVGNVNIWDVAGESLQTFTLETENYTFVAFSPDDARVAAVANSELHVWDAESGEEVFNTNIGFNAYSIIFTPDGQQLLIGLDAGAVRILDSGDGTVLTQFQIHNVTVSWMIFANDTTVISSSWDRNIVIWDLFSGDILSVLTGHQSAVYMIGLSANGDIVSGGEDGLRLWDVWAADLQTVYDLDGSINTMTVLPAEHRAAVVLTNYDILYVDTETGEILAQFSTDDYLPTGIIFLPSDPQRIVTSGLNSDTGTGQVIIWDIMTGERVMTFAELDSPIYALALSPEGSTLAGGDANGNIVLWDVPTGEQQQELTGHSDVVNDLMFSTDGQTLYSSSEDQTLLQWQLDSGEPTPILVTDDVPTELALRDSMLLVGTTNGAIYQLNTQTNDVVHIYYGHDWTIRALAFSPDGTTFVSSGSDKDIRLWDIANGQEIYRYVGNADFTSGLYFSEDGHSLISSSWDGRIRVWRFDDLNSLLAWVYANRYIYQPTCIERETYDILPLCDESGTPPDYVPVSVTPSS